MNNFISENKRLRTIFLFKVDDLFYIQFTLISEWNDPRLRYFAVYLSVKNLSFVAINESFITINSRNLEFKRLRDYENYKLRMKPYKKEILH